MDLYDFLASATPVKAIADGSYLMTLTSVKVGTSSTDRPMLTLSMKCEDEDGTSHTLWFNQCYDDARGANYLMSAAQTFGVDLDFSKCERGQQDAFILETFEAAIDSVSQWPCRVYTVKDSTNVLLTEPKHEAARDATDDVSDVAGDTDMPF